ncbi:FecCD family ABC transporter permease [Chromohalobacter canadensis]|uniref:Iron ABC transporter permease n=1 Tax=Chromohalobacter canadensis TaxID=141389 RepID=A0ABZ0YA64_9GAMM|nr:iron ABC transporter permease [Chromohalobacter canadensis]MCK0768565.1 iron ABC transporter permease [Chromohalobacter canadensis]MCT8467514.1 iron ABC transporter permease [Chromohalobacter canadensis]MCT8470738.1 iron ABC transporter permease [Chromohalobacter canadensis]MCT8498011.1 iron ABC transporter permease [Chromohalobacter canadensis]WQH08342.1 iron ABC transporter permease [Chromohalobacter canadensis]
MLNHRASRIAGLLLSLVLVATAFAASVMLGTTDIAPPTFVQALVQYDPTRVAHIIIVTERLPRAVIAALVGASLAIAGALMQTVTRNPLASPGILGINAGAMFFVVVAVSLLPLHTPAEYVWAALLGALVAACLVVMLSRGRQGELSSLRVVLAGVAVTAMFVSFSQGLLIVDQQSFESVLYWLAGSVSGRELSVVMPLLPLFGIALLLCILLVRHANALMLGDDMVKGLGMRAGTIKLLLGLVVILLAGSSVALAGMIGFVGLIVPHMARGLFGVDHRWLLPACALLGASLLLLADVASRFLMPPQDVPVGVMTALIGTPFFIYLARRKQI